MTNVPVTLLNETTNPALTNYSQLLEVLYASLWHYQGMEAALRAFQDHFKCCSATLMALQTNPRQVKYGWTIGVPEDYGQWYIANNMVSKDIAVDFFEQQSAQSQGFTASSKVLGTETRLLDIVPEEFKPWLESEKIIDTTGFVIPGQENEQLMMVLQRNQQSGFFSDEDLEQLNLLTPHIRQAVQLFVKFYRQQSDNDSLQAAINTLQQPTIVLNNMLQVLHVNDAVAKLLKKNSFLSIVDNQIQIEQADVHYDFTFHACRLVSHRVMDVDQHLNTTVTIPSKKGNVMMTMSPMFSQDGEKKVQGLLLQIFVPEQQARLRATDIQKHFNITLAQAEVCLLLAKGMPLKDIADKREVSVNTIREQLRQIYKKTQFARQAELVTAILRIEPAK